MTRKLSWLFFVAAVLSLGAGLVPLFKGGSVNVFFMSSSVLWLVMGLVAGRNGRPSDSKDGGTS